MIGDNWEGAQHGFFTVCGFITCINVCMMACPVELFTRGKAHSPEQYQAVYPCGWIIQSWMRREEMD